MDLICPRCGEPWDFDSLHDEAHARFTDTAGMPPSEAREVDTERARAQYDAIFKEVSSEWRSQGCRTMRSIRGTDEPCTPAANDSAMGGRAELAATAYDLLGDDLDGAAAMLEDSL